MWGNFILFSVDEVNNTLYNHIRFRFLVKMQEETRNMKTEPKSTLRRTTPRKGTPASGLGGSNTHLPMQPDANGCHVYWGMPFSLHIKDNLQHWWAKICWEWSLVVRHRTTFCGHIHFILVMDRVGKKGGNTHISQDGGKYWEIRLILNLQI